MGGKAFTVATRPTLPTDGLHGFEATAAGGEQNLIPQLLNQEVSKPPAALEALARAYLGSHNNRDLVLIILWRALCNYRSDSDDLRSIYRDCRLTIVTD